MGIRFSKSIKLGNYLRLNLSKSGVSATVGKKGATVNLSKRGTYLNLSPSAVGIKGTGLSYRQKISQNTIGSLFGAKAGQEKAEKAQEALPQGGSQQAPSAEDARDFGPYAGLVQKPNQTSPAGNKAPGSAGEAAGSEPAAAVSVQDVLDAYEQNMEARVRIHRYADPVLDRETFDALIEAEASEAGKELYALCLARDEDAIENFLSAFMNNLDLPYDVRVSYELEDDVLYADLDLPEIEDLGTDYPAVAKGRIVNKKKTAAALREEYAQTVFSLGVFLSASFFNASPTIESIVLSGFTTVRNADGDPVDKYLYSVKFTRKRFEETDIAAIDDLKAFYLSFENRVNLSASNTFKAVKPYGRPQETAVAEDDAAFEDALLALAGLGFPQKSVRAIAPALKEKACGSTSEYVREGLKLLTAE
ncbi:MAG: DUF4236 domain-containing protein [Lachnospiraceae bacterium]|nr:DUF4236 domain-containing protein [Lachnospiraceae bacterium]